MIEEKSLKAWGRDYKISPHFTLKEMACKDGSDLVLYSTALLTKLEELRAYVGGTITITSGYRTAAYNASMKPPGAKNSQHIKGTAADIIVRKNGDVIPAKLICCLAQSLGFRGVGYISDTAVHVDMRAGGSYRGDERKGYGGNVGGDFYRYFGVAKSQIEALKYSPPTPTPKPTPAPTPKKEEKKKEDEEMIYKTVKDVPSWGRKAVQLRVDHGWCNGENLPDTLVRVLTIIDNEDKYIANMEDVPEWARSDVERLVAEGRLKGTGTEEIGMRLSTLRAIIVAERGRS